MLSAEAEGQWEDSWWLQCIIIVVIYCKYTLFSFADPFGIQEPFPSKIYPIEGNSAQVTCVAFDPSGLKTPERIQFMRKDNFARYTNITATDNFYFEENVTLQADQGE